MPWLLRVGRNEIGVADVTISFRVSPRVHAFNDSAVFGRAVARAARLEYATIAVHRFPDGESLVRVRPPVGRHAFLVRSLQDPNASSLRRCSPPTRSGAPERVA